VDWRYGKDSGSGRAKLGEDREGNVKEYPDERTGRRLAAELTKNRADEAT
jgi:hypothetical protein